MSRCHQHSVSTRSPEERRVRIFAILRQLTLHSSQQQPLLLAVENLHWIDATSEAWLASLVECLTAASILLVVTYRPGATLAARLVQSVATQMALSRLLPEDSRTVVQAVLQTTPLPESLWQTIITSAAGNPFFLEELTWAVKEQSPHPGALGLPDTIQSVLAARIDHLPPMEKRLLQTAAVIGTEVAVPLLGHRRYSCGGRLPGPGAPPGGRVPLRDAPFSGVGLHLQTRAHARGGLHELAARATTCPAYPSCRSARNPLSRAHTEQVERLAHHALQGEVWDKALLYSRQAGDKAMPGRLPRGRGVFRTGADRVRQLPEQRDTHEQAIDLRSPWVIRSGRSENLDIASTLSTRPKRSPRPWATSSGSGRSAPP